MRINDILSNIEIPDDLNAVVQNSIRDAEMYRRKRQRYNRIFASSAAAVFVMFTSLIIGQPAWARSIPFIANVFDYVNENLIVKGQFTPYVTNINETVQSNGIGITITEIYCDGENLFISYNINSCESFSDLADTTYMGNQIELDQTITITITDGDSVPVSLDDIGNGQYVYGQFTDDHNYVGASSYLQEKEAFPEKFTADICIDEVRILSDREVNRDCAIAGNWRFSIPVEVNRTDLSVLYPDVENRGHTIDKITVSPFLVSVYTSYPDIYSDRKYIDYDVVCFSDLSDVPLACNGIAGDTQAFYKFNRADMKGSLRIYVVDYAEMRGKGENTTDENVIKKYAITDTVIQLD